MDNIRKNKGGLTNSFVSYASPEQVWWCNNLAVFELFQKLLLLIYAHQFMKSQIISLTFVILDLESVEKKGKITKKYIEKSTKNSKTKRPF